VTVFSRPITMRGKGGGSMSEKGERKRRKWSASEKLRIVLTCLQPGVEVSEVCRREGINPTMFYNWKKRLMASASQVFEEKPKKRDLERERIERETCRLKDVIAEITAENLELKKTLSG
jgi:transposase